jgi:ABC-2 type transport system permease protein
MNEIVIVFTTELLRKLRSRVFWLATLGGVAAIAAVIIVPGKFGGIDRGPTADVVLAGPPALRAQIHSALDRAGPYRVVAEVDRLPNPVTVAFLKAHRKAGAAFAASLGPQRRLRLDIYPRDLAEYYGADYSALSPLNISLVTGVARPSVDSALRISVKLHAIDGKFSDTQSAATARSLGIVLVVVLYVAIVIASQAVMAAVAEEKTSRIAEILVATIEPRNLLAGKTFAAAAVAMAQLVMWLATAAVLLPNSVARAATLGGSHTEGSQSIGLGAGDIALFAAFFVTGYLQYATIYAAAASLISRTEDLPIVTTPVIMPVVCAFFLAQYALTDASAPVVVVSSFVPFLSPFVMFARIAMSAVPAWQIALAAWIDVATVFFCFWVAGRVYRVGMLLYGKLPSPQQIFAAARAN